MAEREEELKNLLMKVKDESEIVDLKLNIQEMKETKLPLVLRMFSPSPPAEVRHV